MWICQRCHTENRDASAACEACGSTRSVGRFAPSQPQGYRPVQPPRVTVPAPAREAASVPVPPAERDSEPLASETTPKTGAAVAAARCVGGLLCALLPLLTALIAWQQQEALLVILPPLFVGADAPAWLNWTCLGALALSALLLSLLPGLHTLLLARRARKE